MALQSQTVWQYKTPLKSDYLSTYASHMTTPGLVYMDTANAKVNVVGNDIVFKMPETTWFAYSTSGVPSVSSHIEESIFKIHYQPENAEGTVASLREIRIANMQSRHEIHHLVFLSFNYGMINETKNDSTVTVSVYPSDEFEGTTIQPGTVFVGFIYWHVDPNDSANDSWQFTMNGADLSDSYLQEMGWSPKLWLSKKKPTVTTTSTDPVSGKVITETKGLNPNSYMNYFEVRKHNLPASGKFFNGSKLINLPAGNVQVQVADVADLGNTGADTMFYLTNGSSITGDNQVRLAYKRNEDLKPGDTLVGVCTTGTFDTMDVKIDCDVTTPSAPAILYSNANPNSVLTKDNCCDLCWLGTNNHPGVLTADCSGSPVWASGRCGDVLTVDCHGNIVFAPSGSSPYALAAGKVCYSGDVTLSGQTSATKYLDFKICMCKDTYRTDYIFKGNEGFGVDSRSIGYYITISYNCLLYLAGRAIPLSYEATITYCGIRSVYCGNPEPWSIECKLSKYPMIMF